MNSHDIKILFTILLVTHILTIYFWYKSYKKAAIKYEVEKEFLLLQYNNHLLNFPGSLKIYMERLFNEWKTHGKIIIGVDFDSTISPYNTIDNQNDIDRTISVLKVCQQTGCWIVIHTACRKDRYQEITDYCKKIGIPADSINQTPIDLPYGKEGSKPYCNHFLDDRAALPASLDMLEGALYKMRAFQQTKLNNSDVA